VHTDSPVSRKKIVWAVATEEMMVGKKEIVFAHVYTWNEFIQSQATGLPILKQKMGDCVEAVLKAKGGHTAF